MKAAGVLMLLAALVSAGDEPVEKSITFQEAVDLGLAGNLGLKSVRLTALMERLSVDVADAAWDPTLNSSVSGGESLTPSRSSLSGAALVDVDSAAFSLGVTQPTRVGPTLGVEWRSDRTFTNSTFSTLNPAWDSALAISLTVPLLRGRGRDVQESELRASRASAEGARLDLLDTASSLVQQIADAFWELVYRQDRVRLLEKSVSVARSVEDTERRKLRPEIGRSTRLDVTKAAAETKRREVAVIQGRADVLDAADDLRALILPFTGGKADRLVLSATGSPRDTVAVGKLEQVVESALSRRPDVRKIQTDLQRLQEGVVQARDALDFQLDLRGSVIWRGLAGNLGSSFRDTVDFGNPSAEASITLVVPFGRRAARAELRRARLDLERERVARDIKINEVVVEVRKAYRVVKTALEEAAATREEVHAAQAALDGERKRLDRGSATVLDVSRLEENLTDAELRLLQARTGLERARVAVLRASGALVERFKIKLGPPFEAKR